ncbi:MAG: hypothetical protein AB1791_22370, partial [Chloroflexota bacterium]
MLRPSEESGRLEGGLLLLAALFLFTNALAMSLALSGRLTWAYLWAPLVWLAAMTVAWATLQQWRPNHDPILLPLVGLLTGWGLLLVNRLAANFLWRQTTWLALGTVAMVAIAIVPRNLRLLRRYRYTWLTVGLLLLAATFVLGV